MNIIIILIMNQQTRMTNWCNRHVNGHGVWYIALNYESYLALKFALDSRVLALTKQASALKGPGLGLVLWILATLVLTHVTLLLLTHVTLLLLTHVILY